MTFDKVFERFDCGRREQTDDFARAWFYMLHKQVRRRLFWNANNPRHKWDILTPCLQITNDRRISFAAARCAIANRTKRRVI